MKVPVKAILKELEELMERKNNPFGPKDQQRQSKAETHLSDSK